MVEVYKKSDLNINEYIEEKQKVLLEYSSKSFVDCKIIKENQMEISLEYKTEGLKVFNEMDILEPATKLRLGISLIDFALVENQFFTKILDEQILYVSDDLRIYQLKRVFKTVNLNNDDATKEVIALIGSLFVKQSAKEIYATDNNILLKNNVTKQFVKCEELEELKEVLQNLIETIETDRINNKLEVNKNYYKKNKRTKLLLVISVAVLIIITSYLTMYYIPNRNHQLTAYAYYQKGMNEDVKNELSTVSIQSMSGLTKYILSESEIKLSDLSEVQKDNVLYNLSPDVDSSILDFWVYISQGNIDKAYNQAITNNDAQQKAYALMLEIESVQGNDKISDEEKQTKIEGYQAELDKVTKIITENTKSGDEDAK